ncbi:MAG: NUDIX hydrolase [Gammaproteobacteria bacterium]|nr:NUDIX hydrolase [Gammaproteobacteria bacterium]
MPNRTEVSGSERPGRASRPRDAATLILWRREGEELSVLMGQRNRAHKFMPDTYVFPGGGVDRSDGYAPARTELAPRVTGYLQKGASAHRARALAMAAVRETFEETGLVLGAPTTERHRRVPASWQPFFDTGFSPTLDRLDYLWRAITPPLRTRRFDARFFIAPADALAGEIRGSGELLFLDWIPVSRALGLNLPNITKVVLENLGDQLADAKAFQARTKTKIFHTVRGKRVEEYE